MKKPWILFAAAALAVPLAAQTTSSSSPVSSTSSVQSTGTATTGTSATNTPSVFTMSGAVGLVDQFGNVLTQLGTGQFKDQRGNVFTADAKGRLVDAGGNIVSAPGVTVGTGQSSVTATVPSLPGLQNQTITLGPAVGSGVTAQTTNQQTTSQTLQTGGQNLALTPGLSNAGTGTSLGPNGIVNGKVVSFSPGNSLTIRQPNGLEVTFPVSGVTLPANVTTGRDVTVFTSQSTSGVVQVTGVATGTLTSKPTNSRTLSGSSASTATGGGTIKLASGRSVTVGNVSPATTTTASSSSIRGQVVTVQSFDGSTLTVLQPNGSAVTLRVNSSSSLPSNLGSGNRVVLTTRTVNGVTFVQTVTMATSS